MPPPAPIHRKLALAGIVAGALCGAPVRAEEPPLAPTRAPTLKHFVKAVPPAALSQLGTVDVILNIDVDEAGKVVKVEVATSGGAEFDAAAVAAARQFEFTPGYSGDTPVPVRITYRYRFKMEPAAPPPPPAAEALPGPGARSGAAPPPAVPFSGTVLRKGDRVPLPGATISIDVGDPGDVGGPGTSTLVTESDAEGGFSFPAVPVGDRRVRVGGPDLVGSETTESFKPGKKLVARYFVLQKARYTSVVRGHYLYKETVEQTLEMEEIKRIPGTQGDALKAVQNLPGVARAPLFAFNNNQLIVWGSRPGDTRVYVDDAFLGGTLFHFAGLRAVLPTETVQSLTFTPGAYGPEHGSALGGLLQIDAASPRHDGYHGFLQLDLIDGAFRVEGPIARNLDFALSARRSWIDVFLPLFTPNQFQLSPQYWDYQAMLRWRPSGSDDVELLVFGSDDTVNLVTRGAANPSLTGSFGYNVFLHRGVLRWIHRFEDGAQLNVTGASGFDVPFRIGVQFGNTSVNVDVKAVPYSLRATYRRPIAPFLRLEAGLDFEGSYYNNGGTFPLSGPTREDQAPAGGGGLGPVLSGTEDAFTHVIAPWAALRFSFLDKRLQLTPGLRLAIIEDNGSYDFTVGGMPPPPALGILNPSARFSNAFVQWEPRLAARYEIVKHLAVKAAIGYYSQPPSAQTLFGPGGNVNALPETAFHYVAGFDITPYPTLFISLEAFYKDLRRIVVGNPRSGNGGPALLNEGIGRVYGAEVLIRQQLFKGFFGWVSYTISRSERKDHPDSPDWRLFEYDQTHVLAIIASYKFLQGYTIGARFRYVTGNPYTPPSGAYVNLNTGSYEALSAPLYSGRLSDFQELDLRFDKTWTRNRVTFTLYVDILNVYNAANAEGYQYNYNNTQKAPVAGIPFFPDLGVRIDF